MPPPSSPTRTRLQPAWDRHQVPPALQDEAGETPSLQRPPRPSPGRRAPSPRRALGGPGISISVKARKQCLLCGEMKVGRLVAGVRLKSPKGGGAGLRGGRCGEMEPPGEKRPGLRLHLASTSGTPGLGLEGARILPDSGQGPRLPLRACTPGLRPPWQPRAGLQMLPLTQAASPEAGRRLSPRRGPLLAGDGCCRVSAGCQAPGDPAPTVAANSLRDVPKEDWDPRLPAPSDA